MATSAIRPAWMRWRLVSSRSFARPSERLLISTRRRACTKRRYARATEAITSPTARSNDNAPMRSVALAKRTDAREAAHPASRNSGCEKRSVTALL